MTKRQPLSSPLRPLAEHDGGDAAPVSDVEPEDAHIGASAASVSDVTSSAAQPGLHASSAAQLGSDERGAPSAARLGASDVNQLLKGIRHWVDTHSEKDHRLAPVCRIKDALDVPEKCR